MGHDLGCHTHSDTIAAQHQQTGDLHRKNDRLLTSAVVGIDKFRDLIRKQDLSAQRRKTALDITGCGSGTAGKNVSEVSLFGDEILFVCQNHHGIADRGITVGMIVHGVSDDIRRFVSSAVVNFMQYPEDTALNGFQTVIHIGNGTILDDVGGIVQKVTIHHRPEIGVGIAVFADCGFAVGFRS